jgi:hypothetical protein
MDLPYLPVEIKDHICCILLRLTLDDIEDDPFQLIQSRTPNMFVSIFIKRTYDSMNNIDYYIKLLRIRSIYGNPNILSYKGNSIFHIITKMMIGTQYLGPDDPEYQHLQNKLILLCKYGIDINRKGNNGNTIAHEVMVPLFTYFYSYSNIHYIIEFLQDLGMDIKSIKNNDGFTAHQLGKNIIGSKMGNEFHEMNIALTNFYLNDLSFKKNSIKLNKLGKEFKSLKTTK